MRSIVFTFLSILFAFMFIPTGLSGADSQPAKKSDETLRKLIDKDGYFANGEIGHADINANINLYFLNEGSLTLDSYTITLTNPGESPQDFTTDSEGFTIIGKLERTSNINKDSFKDLTERFPTQIEDLYEKLNVYIPRIPNRKPGSLLTVKANYTDSDGKREKQEIKNIVLDHYKPYWAPTAMPIISRSQGKTKEGESKWSTGVAAGYEYRLRWQDAPFWNTVEPSFGLHGALLNQESNDAFEMGLGGHVSLVQGWFSFGYGYNFSTEEEYLFFGINLLKFAQSNQGVAIQQATGE